MAEEKVAGEEKFKELKCWKKLRETSEFNPRDETP